MDWRNYQFWRKKLRRVDETTAEFELLVQRTKQRITLGDKIGRIIQMSQRTSDYSKKTSKREIISRNLRNIRENLPFFKKFR